MASYHSTQSKTRDAFDPHFLICRKLVCYDFDGNVLEYETRIENERADRETAEKAAKVMAKHALENGVVAGNGNVKIEPVVVSAEKRGFVAATLAAIAGIDVRIAASGEAIAVAEDAVNEK